jgi:hypothetical protein
MASGKCFDNKCVDFFFPLSLPILLTDLIVYMSCTAFNTEMSCKLNKKLLDLKSFIGDFFLYIFGILSGAANFYQFPDERISISS